MAKSVLSKDVRMIDVPEVDAGSYDPDRPISGLIHMQLVHLSAAEQRFPPDKRTGVNIAMLHTEGQASKYIAKVTAMLHPRGGKKKKKPGKLRPSAKRTLKKAPAKPRKGRKAAKARR